MWARALGAVTALALTAAPLHAAGGSLPLKTVANVPLPGGSSRLDYATVDSQRNRLYIAHLGGGLVIVFDTKKRRVVKTIPAPNAHGVLAVPELGRVFASATGIHKVLTIDERTLKVIGSAPAGDYPDGIAWDSDDRRVYVSDETGGVETVLNAKGRPLTIVRLGGETGNVQYDPVSRRVLVDVQSRNELAVIDPRSERVTRRLALPGCEHDHGLLVDAPRRLAFIACDGNATLLTLDLRRMKVTGRATVGGSPDVLAFDRSLRRLYVSSESGEVAVFAERGHGLIKLGQAFLAAQAHTVAVDSRTHLVYFPLQAVPKLLIMKPTR
jgi:DNA-binding beta-propeller fold protein YncE